MPDTRETGVAMPLALSVRGLHKTYPTSRDVFGRTTERFTAVSDVDLDVRAGSTLAVVGESGAGKSTVGRLVLRLIDPDAGSIEIAGTDITALPRRELRSFRSRVAMIFQDPFKSLNPRTTIEDSLHEPLRNHGHRDRDERAEIVRPLLERVELGPRFLGRYPYEMSGGQLQRVAIARALVTNPDVVVCDEPVAALDMSIRAHVVNLLHDLQRERGLTYLFITHDLSLVQVIADDVLVMRRGHVVEHGSTRALFASPQQEYTRNLLSAIPAAHPRERTFTRNPSAI